jgi:hypothetical protein
MTDFNKPYIVKEFDIELTHIYIPRCAFCHSTSEKMMKASLTTSQDGFETGHGYEYLCMDCVDKIVSIVTEK